MKIGFTGTQRGMTDAQKNTLRKMVPKDAELHHGDCVGADAEAHDIFRFYGLACVGHPPSNSTKRAFKFVDEWRPEKDYLERNKDIVRETDMLIAAPGEDTELLRSGTWSTVRYARKLGRLVIVIYPNGSRSEDVK